MANRYKLLQDNLKKMYEEKQLTVSQVKSVLEYAQKDIFAHMRLYMACIGIRKQ